MKLGIFLILIAATFYVAGMFRSIPLLILFITECLLIPVMYILLLFFMRKVSFELVNHKGIAEKETDHWCVGKITNKGKMPVSRLKLQICLSYGSEAKTKTRYLYGGAEKGENTVRFAIHPDYCGLIRVKIKKLRVYDYLTLFSVSKKLDQEFELAVFPNEGIIPAEAYEGIDEDRFVNPQFLTAKTGDAYGEIRQIREYQSGDHFRNIHWNQSARMDGLWVREYERESDPVVKLFLEIQAKKRRKITEEDSFYTLLASVISSILMDGKKLRVYWYDDAKDGFDQADVREKEHCRELLYRIYLENLFGQKSEKSRENIERFKKNQEDLLLLKDDLCLYRGDYLLHRFQKGTNGRSGQN